MGSPRTFEEWFELGQRLGISKNRLYQMWIQVFVDEPRLPNLK